MNIKHKNKFYKNPIMPTTPPSTPEDWAKIIGVSYSSIYRRIKAGQLIEIKSIMNSRRNH